MKNLGKKVIHYSIVIFILLYFTYGLTTGQTTTCENSKICIPIKNCKSINQKLYNKNLLESEIQELRSIQCGYKNNTVYVCCKSPFPKPPICGPFNLETRIFGGNVARIYDYPWTVLIGILNQNGEFIKYICGGSLISDQYILTAAHCIKIMSTSQPDKVITRRISKIRLGEWNVSNVDVDSEFDPEINETIVADPILDIDVGKIIVHEKYHPLSKYYDIALIKLSVRVNFTTYIKPICLPDKNKEINDDLIVIGWGRTETEIRSNLKRFAGVPKWNITKCADHYKKLVANIEINSSQLCAGKNNVDSCSGDSGGSLIANDATNPFNLHYYLAGIVSFGTQNCGKSPGVYTNVKSYLRWIYDNIEQSE